MSSPVALGIDIGGGSIKAALVDCHFGQLHSDLSTVSTPQSSPQEFVGALQALIDSFSWRGCVGIGFPGVVKKGVVHTAVHLNADWIGENIERELSTRLGTSAVVINDADAAGLAEIRFGVGKQGVPATRGVLLLLTLGTGIGSALFVNGNLIPNTEFGHIYLDDGTEAEEVASASLRTKLNLSWSEYGERVDRYLRYVQRIISPDMIIIGGGVSENWEKFAHFLSMRGLTQPAELRNHAGLIGAALYASGKSGIS